MCADALLARANQERGQEPLVERDMATLKEGADCNRELLAAALAVALIQPGRVAMLVELSSVPHSGQTGPSGQSCASSHLRAFAAS